MSNNKKSLIRAFGAFSEKGTLRHVNEDTYLVDADLNLFGVSDGFGGQGIGDEASKSVLETAHFFIKNGLGDSEVTLPFVYRQYYNSSSNFIFNAFLYANEKLIKKNQSEHINGRGGASSLIGFIDGQSMTLANVGGCSAFLVRNGRVQSLVRPRTYNHYKGQFQGSWNAKWAFPLISLGQTKDIEPEIVEFQVQKGDIVLLCTDGLYGSLSELDFTECFSMFTSSSAMDIAIREQNQRLVELAKARGSVDNMCLVSIVCG